MISRKVAKKFCVLCERLRLCRDYLYALLPSALHSRGKRNRRDCPDIPEVVTEGDSIAEVLSTASTPSKLILGEYMRRERESLGHRSEVGRHIRIVELPLSTQGKLSRYSAKHKTIMAADERR